MDEFIINKFNSQFICGYLKICPNKFLKLSFDDYLNEIIKDKPKNKPIFPSYEKNYTFLHISDFHFDSKYAEGSDSKCTVSVCCRNNSGKPLNSSQMAGYWGSVSQCDIPLVKLFYLLS